VNLEAQLIDLAAHKPEYRSTIPKPKSGITIIMLKPKSDTFGFKIRNQYGGVL
jgi:hypothetical protein